MKFWKGFFVGLVLAVSLSATAFIGGGIFQHTHSGPTTGGSTLGPSLISATGAVITNGPALVPRVSSNVMDQSDSLTSRFIAYGPNPATPGKFSFTELSSDNSIGQSLFIAGNGAFSSSKTCATNYTRINPNFCLWTAGAGSRSNANVTGVCTSVTAPAGAIAVLAQIVVSNFSSNTLNALDVTTVNLYNDATCITTIGLISNSAKEFVALASTQLSDVTVHTVLPVVGGTSQLLKTGGAAASTIGVTILGYFD